MIRDSAGQVIGAQMVNASTGAAFNGTVTVYVTGDGGVQAIGATGSGICTAEGNGYYTYVPSQAETDYALIAFTFIGSGAIPATIQVATVTLGQQAALAGGGGAGTDFSELYGELLDQELASEDRTKRFTTARRKAAINKGQREFVKLTECLQRQGSIPIVSSTAEYDLEVLTDFTWLTKQGIEVAILQADATYRYLSGRDFPLRTIDWLNRFSPGWRSATAGTPSAWYQREDGGHVYLGLTAAPSVPVGETWSITVPYLAIPSDMVDDTDGPFVINSNAKTSLWPWHQALVHYAAAQLEKLRKERERSDEQMKTFAGYVADYLQKQRQRGGSQVTFVRDYQAESRGRMGQPTNPLRDF